MVGMAVATTVDSIEAKNRLSMIPAVTNSIRFRDIYCLSRGKYDKFWMVPGLAIIPEKAGRRKVSFKAMV